MTVMELRYSPERKRAKLVESAPCELAETSKRKSSRRTSKNSTSRKEKLSSSKSSSENDVGEDLCHSVPICREIFDVLSKVGEGTFSKVYLAQLKNQVKETFALKHVVPTSAPFRVANELLCLQKLGGRNNVIDVKTTIREEDHTVFVLPYFPHDKFQDYMRDMTIEEMKDYFRNLFRALKWVHSHNIIHRDVKPSNFLYSRTLKRYALVDFGLAMQAPGSTGLLSGQASPASLQSDAQRKGSETRGSGRVHLSRSNVASTSSVPRGDIGLQSSHDLRTRRKSSTEIRKTLCPASHERQEICTFCTTRTGQTAPRAGTPGFRSPEVLMKLPNQSTAVDIWSVGVILLSILSGRYPFFKAPNDMAALAQIITIFGGKEILRESIKFGKDVVCSPSPPPQDLQKMCERLRGDVCPSHPLERKQTNDSTNDDEARKSISTNDIRRKRKSSSRKLKKKAAEKINKSPDKSLNLSFGSESDRTTSPNTSFEDSNAICICVPKSAYDLLKLCLCINPAERITAADALEHPFLSAETDHQSDSMR